jgi:hypothetical protein
MFFEWAAGGRVAMLPDLRGARQTATLSSFVNRPPEEQCFHTEFLNLQP